MTVSHKLKKCPQNYAKSLTLRGFQTTRDYQFRLINMKNKFLLIAFLSVSVFACVSEPEFSNIPEIGFSDIKVFTKESKGDLGTSKVDSVVMTISFRDGDGDLGLTEEDYKAYVKKTGDSVRTFDVDILIAKNGKFIKSNPADKYGGQLKGGDKNGEQDFRFKKGSKLGPIEGTIDYSAKFEYKIFQGIPNATGKRDTVKFNIKIRDRALNVSNSVETSPIVIFAN